MESYECLNGTATCIEFNTFRICTPEENHCVQGHGFCGIDKTNQTECLCLRCFTGDRCEDEISRN